MLSGMLLKVVMKKQTTPPKIAAIGVAARSRHAAYAKTALIRISLNRYPWVRCPCSTTYLGSRYARQQKANVTIQTRMRDWRRSRAGGMALGDRERVVGAWVGRGIRSQSLYTTAQRSGLIYNQALRSE